jgi:uncharacterized protein YkwD
MSRLSVCLPAIAAAVLALAAPAASQASQPCRGAHAVPDAANAATVRHAMLCLLNRERARRGLPRLRQQRSLTSAASTYARLMVAQGFFDHVSPAGSTMAQRIKRTNYLRGVRAWSVGENLAWATGSAAAPAQIVTGWMHSAGHRANILSGSFREIGIGIAAGAPRPGGGEGGTYAAEFGGRHR